MTLSGTMKQQNLIFPMFFQTEPDQTVPKGEASEH